MLDYRGLEGVASYGSLAGISLGCSSLGSLFLHMALILEWPRAIMLPCMVLFISISCCFIASLCVIVLFSFKYFLNDVTNMKKSATITAANMALMNIGACIAAVYNVQVGRVLWYVGLSNHFIFYSIFVYASIMYVRVHGSYYELLHAGCFVPIVGITVAATSCTDMDAYALCQGIWYLGTTGWALFVVPILYKYYSTYSLNNRGVALVASGPYDICGRAVRNPIGAISMAPFSLVVAGYIVAFQVSADSARYDQRMFLEGLYVIMLGIGLLTLVEYPRFMSPPYTPAIAAITFPACIFAVATIKTYGVLRNEVLYVFSHFLSLCALAVVLYALIYIIIEIFKYLRGTAAQEKKIELAEDRRTNLSIVADIEAVAQHSSTDSDEPSIIEDNVVHDDSTVTNSIHNNLVSGH